MENEKDKTASENTNEQPKPTDDVQMDIETVVPSAHQAEVTPGKSEDPADVEEEQPSDYSVNEPKEEHEEGKKVTEGEEGAEKPATDADQSGTDEASSPEKNVPDEEKESSETEETDSKNADSDNEHNGIETVTP